VYVYVYVYADADMLTMNLRLEENTDLCCHCVVALIFLKHGPPSLAIMHRLFRHEDREGRSGAAQKDERRVATPLTRKCKDDWVAR